MATYIESADRPPESRPAAADVYVGEAVAETGSGTVTPFDGSSHTIAEFLGVADDPLTGDQIALDDNETGGFIYESAEDDRVVYGGDADRDRIKIRTPEDTGGNEAAASISDGTIVGFIDTSAGTLSSTSEYHGRVVEEGYDDGESTPTTYNRSNGNFVPLGVAYKDDADSYDDVVRVEVRNNL